MLISQGGVGIFSIVLASALTVSETMYRKWLKDGLAYSGKTQRGLAAVLGIDASAVTNMLKGTRRIRADELPKIAAYLGVKPPLGQSDSQFPSERVRLTHVQVRKVASGGVWREAGALLSLDKAIIPAVPDPRISGLTQWADRIESIDVNQIFKIGDYAIFVPFSDVRSKPQDGDIVEVERKRGSLTEVSIRRVRIKGGVTELWPESDSPEWQTPTPYPLIHKNEYLTITGLFVGMYRPASI